MIWTIKESLTWNQTVKIKTTKIIPVLVASRWVNLGAINKQTPLWRRRRKIFTSKIISKDFGFMTSCLCCIIYVSKFSWNEGGHTYITIKINFSGVWESPHKGVQMTIQMFVEKMMWPQPILVFVLKCNCGEEKCIGVWESPTVKKIPGHERSKL